jgi:hypothetical protein
MTTYYIDKDGHKWTVAEFRRHVEIHMYDPHGRAGHRHDKTYENCYFRPFRRVTEKA